ncbi:MAG: hypothetical protein AAF483_22560, partial [Planctomycetota bacterium]
SNSLAQVKESELEPASNKVPSSLAAWKAPPKKQIDFATPEVLSWLEKLIRNNLPPDYEDDRKWGKQKEVWDGLEWRREGLKLETKRRKKMVNAGTWTRYRVAFVKPEETLKIRFDKLDSLEDGRVAFAIVVECSLDVFGRLSQWVRDVQLMSISANADAACRLTLEGTVAFKINPLVLPPDFSLKPHITNAHVDLTYYRVRRISQVGGDFAKVLGKGLRGVVDEKIEDLNGKLVDKINKQLVKHEDKLSFSAQDWLNSKLPIPAEKSEPNDN